MDSHPHNLLVDDLPTGVWLAGTFLPVRVEARVCLKMAGFVDAGLPPPLDLFFIASNTGGPAVSGTTEGYNSVALFPPLELTRAFVSFYTRPLTAYGRAHGGLEKHGSTPPLPLYSLTADACLIYAAFRQTYQIEDPGGLHWFVFRGLLEGLPDDCLFSKVCGWRGARIRSGMSKEERSFYRKMKRLYALPDGRPAGDRDGAFSDALNRL